MNNEKLNRLVYGLSDVDDKYIEEVIEVLENQDQKKIKQKATIKYIFSAVVSVAACLAIVIAGVNIKNIVLPKDKVDQKQTDGSTYSGNRADSPVQEVSSMDEAEKIVGFKMKIPAVSAPYGNLVINVYDGKIIEVSYMNSDETDEGYVIRKAAGSDDISGDCNEYKNTETKEIGDFEVTLKGNDDKYSLAIWNYDGYAFSVSAVDHPMGMDAVKDVIMNVK